MIKYLTSATKGLTFVWGILMTFSITIADDNSIDVDDVDALNTIFETIAEPILQSIQVSEDQVNNKQDYVLDQQQNRFSPSLVLNKHKSNEMPVTEDSEETVILEIPSSSETQPNRRKGDLKGIVTEDSFAKYKQLQDKIGSLLNKEKISDNTKYLLSTAFNKVINQIKRPCISNNRSKDLTIKTNRRLLGKLNKAARKHMLKSWKYRFNKLIDRYREQDDSEKLDSKENSKFLAKLRDFFFEMHNDFQNLTRRYELNCNAVNVKKTGISEKKVTVVKHTAKLTLDKNEIGEKKPAKCQLSKICPYELKLYFTDFFNYLLDKIKQVFHNYMKMYSADLSKESSNEKKSFMRFMDEVENQVEEKYDATIRGMGDFFIDASTDINVVVEDIKKNIDMTVENVKTLLENALTNVGRAGFLSSKIQSSAKKDIMTNADIALDEAQEKFKAKMCKSFETCYGKERKKA